MPRSCPASIGPRLCEESRLTLPSCWPHEPDDQLQPFRCEYRQRVTAPILYLTFPGHAREALEFYASVFGGELQLHTYEAFSRTDGPADAIAHGELRDGPVSLFGSDAAPDDVPMRLEGVSLSLLGTAAPGVLHAWFDSLAEGGMVIDPLGPKAWGASDGEVLDRFGLRWLIGYELSTPTDRPPPTEFVERNLRGARFVRSDLSNVVMRGVSISGVAIDGEIEGALNVNGVDVAPFIEAELDKRFPGRSLRRADTPDALASAWAAVEQAWAAAVERALGMPDGTVDVSIADEWSFAQTLRHLVLATDAWLRGAIIGVAQPFHPIGQPFAEYISEGLDMSIFTTVKPTFAEVLDVRADHQSVVRSFIADATPTLLAELRPNPWAPEHAMSVRDCIGVILNEEWEHLRFALRDLDEIPRG
jgi:uncharacterized glyoxalase superfamily protein PhnB